MQTFIVHKDFEQSAKLLDQKRLGAQIYEGIHILSSIIGVNDKLVNPKRDVSNHPASMLWLGYEWNLYLYIEAHIEEWKNRGYKTKINAENLSLCFENLPFNKPLNVSWITDQLIKVHRSVLIQKNPEFYKSLWPNNPDNLTMRYDWRKT